MASLHLGYGQRHLGKEACGRLQVGVLCLGSHCLECLAVVGDAGCLQHLASASKYQRAHGADGVVLGREIGAQAYIGHLCMEAHTVGNLEEEARTDVMGEGVGVAEVFRMVEILQHEVGAVVLVEGTVGSRIGIVQRDADAILIGIAGAHIVELAQIGIAEHMVLAKATIEDHPCLHGVEVGIVADAFLQGRCHLANTHLHGREAVGIAEGRGDIEDEVAGVGRGTSVEEIGYLALFRHRYSFQEMELRGELANDIGTRLGIPDAAKITVGRKREDGVGHDGASGDIETLGGYYELVAFVGERLTDVQTVFFT